MRRLLLILTLFTAAWSPAAHAQVKPVLTSEVRAELVALRAEIKFKPDAASGYQGADTPEDLAPLNASVNGLIDQVLAHTDGPISETDTFMLIGLALPGVSPFATEDRERAYAYFNQIWTILGLKGEVIPTES